MKSCFGCSKKTGTTTSCVLILQAPEYCPLMPVVRLVVSGNSWWRAFRFLSSSSSASFPFFLFRFSVIMALRAVASGKELQIVGYRHFKLKDDKIIGHWRLIDGESIENQLKTQRSFVRLRNEDRCWFIVYDPPDSYFKGRTLLIYWSGWRSTRFF